MQGEIKDSNLQTNDSKLSSVNKQPSNDSSIHRRQKKNVIDPCLSRVPRYLNKAGWLILIEILQLLESSIITIAIFHLRAMDGRIKI